MAPHSFFLPDLEGARHAVRAVPAAGVAPSVLVHTAAVCRVPALCVPRPSDPEARRRPRLARGQVAVGSRCAAVLGFAVIVMQIVKEKY